MAEHVTDALLKGKIFVNADGCFMMRRGARIKLHEPDDLRAVSDCVRSLRERLGGIDRAINTLIMR